jgi:NADPH:quinone reductase-like Zn-dependent oxidoreductase
MPAAVRFERYGERRRAQGGRRPPSRPRPGAGDRAGQGRLAISLGIASRRIDTIVDWAAAGRYGTKSDGNMVGARAEVLAELAGLIDAGRLEVPIAGTYPLAQVREAFRDLERRHTLGKIVLIP